MARFVTGNTFGTTDTVTAALLNQAVNDAAISTDSVDGSTIELNSNALRLKDAGITTAKIADSSSKTTGVTFAKMQHISTAKVLGRVTAGEGDVEEAFDFKDEDDMSSNSATALASQQSIKAYVDATAVFTKSFVSSDQTFPSDRTVLSVAHSLGVVPKIIQVFAKMTATTGGYASGDFVLLGTQDAPGQGQYVVYCSSTHVKFLFSGAAKITNVDGTNGRVSLSSSNCSLVLKAFA